MLTQAGAKRKLGLRSAGTIRVLRGAWRAMAEHSLRRGLRIVPLQLAWHYWRRGLGKAEKADVEAQCRRTLRTALAAWKLGADSADVQLNVQLKDSADVPELAATDKKQVVGGGGGGRGLARKRPCLLSHELSRPPAQVGFSGRETTFGPLSKDSAGSDSLAKVSMKPKAAASEEEKSKDSSNAQAHAAKVDPGPQHSAHSAWILATTFT